MKMSQSMKLYLKWGHFSNQDTLISRPKGGRIRGSPLFVS